MQTIPSVDIYELQRSLQYQLKLQAAGVVMPLQFLMYL